MGFAPFAFSQWALGSIYPCSATKTVFGAARSPYPTRFAGQSVERCSTSSSSVVWRLEVPHYEGTDWAWPNGAYFRKFVKSLQLRTVSDAIRERLSCAVAGAVRSPHPLRHPRFPLLLPPVRRPVPPIELRPAGSSVPAACPLRESQRCEGRYSCPISSSNFSRFINKVNDRPWRSALGRRRAMPRGARLAYPCLQQNAERPRPSTIVR